MESLLSPPLSFVRSNANRTVLRDVVSQKLCVRCGACKSLCPQNAIEFDENNYPRLAKAGGPCIRCAVCSSVCPGKDVPIPRLYREVHHAEYDHENILGVVDYACLSSSAHEEVRQLGSSGGTVTQLLLTLMRKGIIRKALLAGNSPSEPWKGRSFIAQTEAEVLASAQSKYTIIPQLECLDELLDSGDPFALVGLPCHLHAFRKLQSLRPEIAANAKLVVGLFCHMNVEMKGTLRLLERAGVTPLDVERIEYRSGPWPGQAVAHLRNGEVRPLHGPKDAFTDGTVKYLKLLYYPQRCLLCMDYSSELADISVGDPWLRDRNGDYTHPEGHSLTLVRTPQGKRIFDQVLQSGDIRSLPLSLTECRNAMEGMRRRKKVGAMIRIQSRNRKGLPSPTYHIANSKSSLADRLREKQSSMTRILGRSHIGRRAGSLFAFSSLGNVLFRIVRWTKERRRMTSSVEPDSSSMT